MKKNLNIILILCLCMFTLIGCSKTAENNSVINDSADKLNIVCTTFPQYDWVKKIIGNQIDDVELTLLLDDGVDIHSYQPTAEDIATIATCDVFIYVGGESDKWVEDALTEATNKDMKVINLMEVIGDFVKEEEFVEGMEHEHEHEGESHGEETEFDEHIWLSIKNAEVICNEIYNTISALDNANSETYKNNLKAYTEKLSALDTEYKKTIEGAKYSTIIFGDRFPFRYMIDDYGLDYYAAFPGCSAETEASFNTIMFLAEKMDELELPAIFVIERSNQSIAQTIVNNTEYKNQKILVLDSIQSVTSKDVSNGADYLSVMESNLEVLKEALN